MKRIISILCVLMLITVPCFAEFDLSNMSESELLDLINQANAQLEKMRTAQSDSLESLEFSGDKTKILTNINIEQGPCRVTFEQQQKGDYSVSYVAGSKSRELMSGSGSKCVKALTRTGVFEFDIEASSPWTLKIEPLAIATGPIHLTGNGFFVSDIYTLSASTIVSFTGKYNEFDNYIVDVYTNTGYGWDDDNLYNGLNSSGNTESFDKIIRTSTPIQVFFTIHSKSVDWTITVD